MADPAFELPPVHIESVSFDPDGRIQISYVERSQQSARVNKIETIIVDGDAVQMEADELMEAAIALIDAALLVHRAPPESIRSRNAR